MKDIENILRLNKYLAHCRVCNRKQAVEIVKKGEVCVNGEVILNPFYEVKTDDIVTYKGKQIAIEVPKEYLLMNKPKNMSFLSDISGTKPSVQDLIKKKTSTPLFQVIPLSDKSCGLLILTTDQELLSKFSKPGKQTKTVYEVQLSTPFGESDLQTIRDRIKSEHLNFGITGIDYLTFEDQSVLGLELKTGDDDDIVKIFEEMGYAVIKIDRTFIAGLTKKDLRRGWSRNLTEKEIIFLKYFG